MGNVAAVEVAVGPVAAVSMAAFADFGRRLLHSAGPGAGVPPDAAVAFDEYLDEWEVLSASDGDVTWIAEADAEVAEYLVYAFYRVAKDVTDEAGRSIVPEPAAPFYWLLVEALLDALSGEGGSRAEFATHLKDFWPGEV